MTAKGRRRKSTRDASPPSIPSSILIDEPPMTDRKHSESDTPRGRGWVDAALALASGATGAAAALVAGVSVPTIRRWQRKSEFKALVSQTRAEMISETLGKLISVNTSAVNTLVDLLTDEQSSIRLGAANKLLDLTLRVRAAVDTEEAIERIKEQIAAIHAERPDLYREGFDCERD
jgi:hypothetical protein